MYPPLRVQLTLARMHWITHAQLGTKIKETASRDAIRAAALALCRGSWGWRRRPTIDQRLRYFRNTKLILASRQKDRKP